MMTSLVGANGRLKETVEAYVVFARDLVKKQGQMGLVSESQQSSSIRVYRIRPWELGAPVGRRNEPVLPHRNRYSVWLTAPNWGARLVKRRHAMSRAHHASDRGTLIPDSVAPCLRRTVFGFRPGEVR